MYLYFYFIRFVPRVKQQSIPSFWWSIFPGFMSGIHAYAVTQVALQRVISTHSPIKATT